MNAREEAHAPPPATGAPALMGEEHRQQFGGGAVTQAADAEASDLDEWSLVDEQAEIVASVSAHSAHEEELTAHAGEHDDGENPTRADHDERIHTRPQKEEDAASAVKFVLRYDEQVGESGHQEPLESATAAHGVATTASSEADDFLFVYHVRTNFVVPEGCLRVRLRVGEQVRPAWCKATQVVDDFVAEFFADAVAEGRKIRLIYMGMLLIRDRAMGEYGIEEDGVIHCVITEAPSTPHRNAAQQSVELKGFSNPANTLLIITGVGVYGLWTLLYHFPHVFSWKSIGLLSLFSAAHMSAMVSRFSSPLTSS